MNIGKPFSKTKSIKYSIVNKYCEGKLKKNLKRTEKKVKSKYKRAII